MAGTEVANVLPSKTMVGFAAVEALAEEGMTVTPTIASKAVVNKAAAFFAFGASP